MIHTIHIRGGNFDTRVLCDAEHPYDQVSVGMSGREIATCPECKEIAAAAVHEAMDPYEDDFSDVPF
ncbi:MAG: hypothetical protein NW202_13375 [Nitrospira sp.]|nr:hypothetical protein [Nitrospira sp.]